MPAVSVVPLEPFALIETPESPRVFRRQLGCDRIVGVDDLDRLLGIDALQEAHAIFVGNALRGLVPVTLAAAS